MKTEQLTAEQEITLIRQLPSKRALDKLVLANLGLCHKVVHKFPLKNAACTYDDLFQEAVSGLIHGINMFDEKRGYRLSTYVYNWIRAYVNRYFQNHGRVIRVPVHVTETALKMRKQVEQLARDLEYQPSSTEIEQHIPGYNQNQEYTRDTKSLNAALSEDGELEDLAGIDNTEATDIAIQADMLLDALRERVSERDYDILCMRFGLNGYPEHTLSEISDACGITRARVHQVQHACIKELREIQRS